MRRVVALRGRVSAIALTGYGMEEDIRKSGEAGFSAHMTKPIDFTKLGAMIGQVAGGASASRILDGRGRRRHESGHGAIPLNGIGAALVRSFTSPETCPTTARPS